MDWYKKKATSNAICIYCVRLRLTPLTGNHVFMLVFVKKTAAHTHTPLAQSTSTTRKNGEKRVYLPSTLTALKSTVWRSEPISRV